MSDKLEKFIRDHRAEFDEFEPSPVLWKKIRENSNPKKRRNLQWKPVLLRVAAVLVVAAISIFSYQLITDKKEKKLAESKAVKMDPRMAELLEAEAYYGNEVNEKLRELDRNYTEFASIKPDVMNDLAELDSAYTQLKTELKNNISNPQVIESMIENYRLKLEILESILEKLKGIKDEEKNVNI